MNRMSRITVIAATALLAAVPAAWAQTGPDAFERAVAPQTSTTSQDAFERAAAAGERTPVIAVHADAFERAAARSESGIGLTRVAAGDAFERALGARTASPAQPGLRDQHERNALGASTPILAAGPETGVEWQQIGAGFALGIVLAAGLALALRLRPRALAH